MIIKQVAKTVLAMLLFGSSEIWSDDHSKFWKTLLFNLGSFAKAVRKVSTHLTDEPNKRW